MEAIAFPLFASIVVSTASGIYSIISTFTFLPDFFDMLHNYDGSQKYIDKFLKYAINRGDDDFWQNYDWFQERFYKDNPSEAGLFDLNRYYHRVFLR
jgi:hypothetical protein